MGGFFSKHDLFGETSEVASDIRRLDFRYRHVIERNKHLIEGKRVLDIASHDGRFTFAALRGAGAKHVVGIEARDHLVQQVQKTFTRYEVDPDSYRFVTGDVFEEIGAIEPGSIDTAMVLGFLYHTARQYELIAALARIGVRDIIIDSKVVRAEKPVVLLKVEGTRNDAQMWDAERPEALSSIPSAAALELYLQEFGYKTERLEPEKPIPNTAKVYRKRRRVTIVGRRAADTARD